VCRVVEVKGEKGGVRVGNLEGLNSPNCFPRKVSQFHHSKRHSQHVIRLRTSTVLSR